MREWLAYEDGNDPGGALTHMWDEQEGMAEIVATEQAPLYDFSHVDPTPCEGR